MKGVKELPEELQKPFINILLILFCEGSFVLHIQNPKRTKSPVNTPKLLSFFVSVHMFQDCGRNLQEKEKRPGVFQVKNYPQKVIKAILVSFLEEYFSRCFEFSLKRQSTHVEDHAHLIHFATEQCNSVP